MSTHPNSRESIPVEKSSGGPKRVAPPSSSRWGKIRHALEICGASLVCVGAINEIIKFIQEHLGSLSFFKGHENYILYGATSIGFGFGTTMYLRMRRLRRFAQSNYFQNELLRHQVDSLQSKLKERNLDVQRYQAAEKPFRNLSVENAQCDKEIFDLFVTKSLIGGQNHREAFIAAHGRVEQNVIQILNATQKIYSDFTQSRCAVSLKVVHDLRAIATHAEHIILKTYARDDDSRRDRSKINSTEYKVHHNSANEAIFLDNQEFFVCDNLVELQDAGKYKNNSKNWHKSYTATIVTGVPRLLPGTDSTDICGILCIDNLRGGFENETARHYVKEQSWRLSVMLYRLFAIRNQLLVGTLDVKQI